MLKEVIAKFPNLRFVLDIHCTNSIIVDQVISIIETMQIKHFPTIVSSHDDIIDAFKRKKPDWAYGAATREAKNLIYSSFVLMDGLFPLKSDYLMIPQTFGNIKVLTSRVVRHVLKRKRALWAWIHEGEEVKTVETKEQAQNLYDMGVEAVFTDYPEKLFEEFKK